MGTEHLDPIPLSALQHWCYCPRQCGLIHLEQAFDDNVHTLRGNALHARVDQPGVETTKGVRVERALPVWHDELGLIGKTDVVEYPPSGSPYPVEYKQGSRHKAATIAACDDVQLAAQAMCLAYTSGRTVPEGAIYYASSKRRRVVPITASLRQQVLDVAAAVRGMLQDGVLPPPLQGDLAVLHCKACSLRERCQPEATEDRLASLRSTLFLPDEA
jgi:CRISPR-associated exonuclease Cas4